MTLEFIDHPAEFFGSYWRQRPGLSQRKSSSSLHRFGIEDLEAVLNLADLRYPNFRIYRDGVIIAPDRYSGPTTFANRIVPNVVNLASALQEFQSGGTLVLQNIELFDPRLCETCKSIEKQFGNAVHITGFLTNGNGAGLAVHEDPIDVFLAQTAGTRLWNVEVERHSSRFAQFNLHEGDTLYIPAFHQHFPGVSSSPSFHLSICVNALSPATIMTELLEKSELMRSLKSELNSASFYLSSARRQVADTQRIAATVDRLPSREEIKSEVNLIVEVLASSSGVRTDFFHRTEQGHSLGDARSGNYEKACGLFHFHDVQGRSALFFNGKKMTVPEAVRKIVGYICRADTFNLNELPGLLTIEKKAELINQLVRIGFIHSALPGSE